MGKYVSMIGVLTYHFMDRDEPVGDASLRSLRKFLLHSDLVKLIVAFI